MINPDECTGMDLVTAILEQIAENDGAEIGIPIECLDGDVILVCRIEPYTPELTSEDPMVVH